jgi:DNA polymerase III delta prime subunit
MIGEYILKRLLDSALERGKNYLQESDSKLIPTRADQESSISNHLGAVNNWSREVTFADLKKAKRTTDIFIELDLFVYPRRVRISPEEKIESIPLKQIFDDSTNHIILLGQPGAGKTTSMKFLVQALFQEEKFQKERFSFPIVIRFRDLNSIKRPPGSHIIYDQIFDILGLEISFSLKPQFAIDRYTKRQIKEKFIIKVLQELKVLLILDGFDELADAKKNDTLDEIRSLALHLEGSTLILTSRTGDFIYTIDNTVPYELCPLSREQISTFALKWLNDQEQAEDFLMKVYDSPFADTTIRPINLAHLCAIYERIGNIPEKPKTVYKKIINLLLEDWDQQRSIKRYSKYAHFDIDRKFDFLCHLAYMLTTSYQSTIFSENDLIRIYNEIYSNYDLVINEAQQVVSEIETHTGLFIQSGFEEFEFAHKSLQEYLAAEYLVKLPSIPETLESLSRIPNELAIAVSISSNPSEYLCEVVYKKLLREWQLPHSFSKEFPQAFLNRLLLEKPDFKYSPRIGIALFMLYSLFIKSNVKDHSMNDIGGLINECEGKLKLRSYPKILEDIRKAYEINFTYTLNSDYRVHRMVVKVSTSIRSRIKLPDGLAKIIYISDSLLNYVAE